LFFWLFVGGGFGGSQNTEWHCSIGIEHTTSGFYGTRRADYLFSPSRGRLALAGGGPVLTL